MKKRIIATTLMLAFMLAGCSRGADNMSSDGTVQNNGSTVQENVGGEQTEIQRSENSELAEAIADLVQSVDGTIVECNTAYGGSRAQTAMHYQVAEDHGFTAIADFQIRDEDGSMTLSVEGGKNGKEHMGRQDNGGSQ